MSAHPPLKSAARRPLPSARLPNPGYEIVFKMAPSRGSVLRGLLDAAGAGLSFGAGVLGSAYAAGARVVFERIEAVEDAAAERRHRERARAQTEDAAASADPEPLAGPSPPR